MKKAKQAAVLCAAGLALSACVADRRDFADLSVSADAKPRAISVLRHLSACPSEMIGPIEILKPVPSPTGPKEKSNKRAPIADAVVGTAVDVAVEAVSISLARAQANLNGSFLATGAYVDGPERVKIASGVVSVGDGCIVVYHGNAGPNTETTIGEGLPADVVAALGLSGQPAFYAELKSDRSNSARVLRMNYLQYAETSALRRGNGRKTVTMAVGFGAPAKTSDDPATGVEQYLFNLGQLEVGSTYAADPSQVAVSSVKANNIYNMVAKVSESQDPSVALEALTTAFSNNKSALATALKEALK